MRECDIICDVDLAVTRTHLLNQQFHASLSLSLSARRKPIPMDRAFEYFAFFPFETIAFERLWSHECWHYKQESHFGKLREVITLFESSSLC
jgi:hypothetical protein